MKQICIFLPFFILSSLALFVDAQQNYSGDEVHNCNNNDEKGPSPDFLYTCNGKPSCQAFLIFKSQPPYNSVSNISVLTSSNPTEVARINNVTRLTVFPTNKEVIVPVNCSCSGQYYQANTTFIIPDSIAIYYTIANDTYQELATCDALKRENPYGEFDLEQGMELQIPLRCACPTTNQTANGTQYLMTYSVYWDDNVQDIGDRFNVSTESILDANGLSENDIIYPFTTILIPLPSKPLSSQTIIQNHTFLSPQADDYRHRTRGRKQYIYMGVGIAAGCFLAFLCVISIAIFLIYRKKARVRDSSRKKTTTVLQRDLLVEIASFDQALKVFKFEELKKATDNFSSKNRIKKAVYRGVFGGKIIAIKRMREDVSKEVNMLHKFNHFNLIKLHGICEKNGCFYLVFEYMENGSLREWLCNNKASKESQSWKHRIQIALDVANGLHYLHFFTKPAYVHKNIRSSSILLNKDLRAKIASFSLARAALKRTNSNALTTHVVGTRGYMAPEYTEAGSVTPKIDVYAFGVVMLELITGKDAVIIQDGEEKLLSAAMVPIMQGGNAEEELSNFVDPNLEKNSGIKVAMQVAKLSAACLIKDAASRPSMDEVVSSLLKIQVDMRKLEFN